MPTRCSSAYSILLDEKDRAGQSECAGPNSLLAKSFKSLPNSWSSVIAVMPYALGTVRTYLAQPPQSRTRMPLPNRVDPFGNLFADPARGLFFGNRGGRIHRDDRALGFRRWVSHSWICCRLDFKGRHRDVWGAGYTELFFLDEPTALAAGHRPCFECRRRDAQAFAAAFARGRGAAPRAAEIDRVLHAERLDGRAKRQHRLAIDDLPDGGFLTLPDEPGSA